MRLKLQNPKKSWEASSRAVRDVGFSVISISKDGTMRSLINNQRPKAAIFAGPQSVTLWALNWAAH
jgi:hypothetical protein